MLINIVIQLIPNTINYTKVFLDLEINNKGNKWHKSKLINILAILKHSNSIMALWVNQISNHLLTGYKQLSFVIDRENRNNQYHLMKFLLILL